MQLLPCPTCKRHVAVGAACPFCAAGARLAAPAAPSPLGRMSRAMVFAGATLAIAPACGGKAKPASANEMHDEERHHGGGGCVDPDPAEIERLEKQKADAPTEADKEQIERELAQARQPSCMPYGAPPRRRRFV